MIFSTQPEAIGNYQMRTNDSAFKSGLYTSAETFHCAVCREKKPTHGRKRIVQHSARYGYKCASCANK